MSKPIVIYGCPNGCEQPRPAWWPAPLGASAPPCSRCDAPLREVRVFREEEHTEAVGEAEHRAASAAMRVHRVLDAAGIPDPQTEEDEEGDPVGSTPEDRVALLVAERDQARTLAQIHREERDAEAQARARLLEDVRPLWEAARDGASGKRHHRLALADAVAAFPSPDERGAGPYGESA